MYCLGICVPINPVQTPLCLHCVLLTVQVVCLAKLVKPAVVNKRKGQQHDVKKNKFKNLIFQSSDRFLLKGKMQLSPCFSCEPAEGTLTPNKILPRNTWEGIYSESQKMKPKQKFQTFTCHLRWDCFFLPHSIYIYFHVKTTGRHSHLQ